MRTRLVDKTFRGNACHDALINARDDNMAASGDTPGRYHVGQQALKPVRRRCALLPGEHHVVETFCQQIGQRR